MDTQLAALIGLAVLLAQVLSKLVDLFVDRKRNGHFTREDRDALIGVLREIRDLREDHHELVTEAKLRNQSDNALAMSRSERDQSLFRLMDRNLELLQDIRARKGGG